MRPERRRDGHDEASSRFLAILRKPLKMIPTKTYCAPWSCYGVMDHVFVDFWLRLGWVAQRGYNPDTFG